MSGGQEPIVHLQMDMHAVINWAQAENEKPWAFCDLNAGASLASFYNELSKLSEIAWSAVNSDYFRRTEIQEGKQAEFLVYDFVPWTLVEKIGVINQNKAESVKENLIGAEHQPDILVERSWYF